MLALVGVGGFACCLISPTIGVLGLILGAGIPWGRFGYSWLTWWVGDAVGVLSGAPFLLAWLRRRPFYMNDWRTVEAAGLGGATLLACFFVFFRNTHCEYILLPLLLWAAFRFDMRGVSTSAASVAFLAAIGASRGSSPFDGPTANESLLFMNSFLAVTITCALYFAAMMEEPKQADAKVLKLNQALRAISECNQALIHATDEKTLLNRVCRLVTEIGGYCMAWVGLAEGDQSRMWSCPQ